VITKGGGDFHKLRRILKKKKENEYNWTKLEFVSKD